MNGIYSLAVFVLTSGHITTNTNQSELKGKTQSLQPALSAGKSPEGHDWLLFSSWLVKKRRFALEHFAPVS